MTGNDLGSNELSGGKDWSPQHRQSITLDCIRVTVTGLLTRDLRFDEPWMISGITRERCDET